MDQQPGPAPHVIDAYKARAHLDKLHAANDEALGVFIPCADCADTFACSGCGQCAGLRGGIENANSAAYWSALSRQQQREANAGMLWPRGA